MANKPHASEKALLWTKTSCNKTKDVTALGESYFAGGCFLPSPPVWQMLSEGAKLQSIFIFMTPIS